jgi:hypothetical protein
MDKAIVLHALDDLRNLPADWNGYGAAPIDRRIIRGAEDFLLGLPGDAAPTPKVVPMTRGRLQLEWHRGNRSLELEFETADQLHYLKWDPAEGAEEEDVIPIGDRDAALALLRWFVAESVHA